VVYEAEGDKVKVTVDSISSDGSQRITNGQASSMAKNMQSAVTLFQMRGRTPLRDCSSAKPTSIQGTALPREVS
jgi:hypothetical protein